jgi:hypothetical protein
MEVPAVLIGGVLLWRRATLGYVAGVRLLLQFGLTPSGLAAIMALQPALTAEPPFAIPDSLCQWHWRQMFVLRPSLALSGVEGSFVA